MRAGDCFLDSQNSAYCLPAVVNIGVQKAGTGELQSWLNAHPEMLVHGGEAHFFDGRGSSSSCETTRQRNSLRLRYARFLWKRKGLSRSDFAGRLTFEKTPAYFDLVDPRIVACAVPAVKLLLMLRLPVARAISAYRMCETELQQRWCRPRLDAVLARTLSGFPPRASRGALQRQPQVRRLLHMGHYASHLSRWLVAFPAAQLRLLWLEQFKADPFGCMAAIEDYLGLRPFDYRSIAVRNKAGLWVVGSSKSSKTRKQSRPVSAAANATLHAYYAQSQRRLADLLLQHNLTLTTDPPPPLLT